MKNIQYSIRDELLYIWSDLDDALFETIRAHPMDFPRLYIGMLYRNEFPEFVGSLVERFVRYAPDHN